MHVHIMDINSVSKASGIKASAIRFYEEKGLIQSIGRSGLRRLFSSQVLEHLALISLGTRAGFTLEEMSSMFTAKGTVIDRKLLIAKAEQLDRKVKELISMRDGLLHAADCKAKNHFECPKFLRLLNIASKRRPKKQKSGT